MKKSLRCVIHHASTLTTLHQVEVALSCGSDGVFLIGHSKDISNVEVEAVRKEFPTAFIGVNRLGRPLTPFTNLPDVSAVWTDNAFVWDMEKLSKIMLDRYVGREAPVYYGGVAFKYQSSPVTPEIEARLALDFVDVITTSGPATGKPPEVSKISKMSETLIRLSGLRDHCPPCLAIASGITPENVEPYLPFVDEFLVATGISKDFYTLDPVKVKSLADTIHACESRASTPCLWPMSIK